MTFIKEKKIPSYDEVLNTFPLTEKEVKLKEFMDKEIKRVFTGESDKFILIIGPCSADNERSVCDYVCRLAGIQEKVKERIIIIPRIYTAKPRSTGEGYKGMKSQPDLNKQPDILEGTIASRKMQIKAIRESGLYPADELLYPEDYCYVEDLLGYVTIGARSVENQFHRLVASGIEVPVGMKNPICGNTSVMLDSIKASQCGHIFKYNNFQVRTSGNLLVHAVIRGSINQYGRYIPNYHYEDLLYICEEYSKRNFKNSSIIVDVSHGNSAKLYYEQPRIALEVLKSRNYSGVIFKMVKGIMLESYILEGSKKYFEDGYGRSITDSCLGWEESEKLILEIANLV